MNWAEERASKIVDQMHSERPSLTIGRQEEIIAAELQQVADECANETVIANQFGFRPYDAIRARFPKEEL